MTKNVFLLCLFVATSEIWKKKFKKKKCCSYLPTHFFLPYNQKHTYFFFGLSSYFTAFHFACILKSLTPAFVHFSSLERQNISFISYLLYSWSTTHFKKMYLWNTNVPGRGQSHTVKGRNFFSRGVLIPSLKFLSLLVQKLYSQGLKFW